MKLSALFTGENSFVYSDVHVYVFARWMAEKYSERFVLLNVLVYNLLFRFRGEQFYQVIAACYQTG
jgi:hypothetical protein